MAPFGRAARAAGRADDRFHPEVLHRQILRRRERRSIARKPSAPRFCAATCRAKTNGWKRCWPAGARGRADQDRRRRQIDAMGRTLGTLGYRETLARGFAVVRAMVMW